VSPPGILDNRTASPVVPEGAATLNTDPAARFKVCFVFAFISLIVSPSFCF
jgi:hypothetical protein